MAHDEGTPSTAAAVQRRLRLPRPVGTIAVAAILMTACGADGDGEAKASMVVPGQRSAQPDAESQEGAQRQPAEDATEAAPRPPHESAELAELFDPILAEHGVRISRGSLIDRWKDATHEPGPDGDHLALYVEPIGDRSAGEYVEGILELTRTLAPLVFERWPGVESFDVCQEMRSSTEYDRRLPPVTLVDITRAQADRIDWSSARLADVVAAGEEGRFEGYHVIDELREHPAYRRALRQSQGA